MISMKLHGLGALKDQLAELKAVAAVRALARAARRAFEPVLEEARARAPRDTGLLAEHIQLRVQRPRDGDAVVRVGLRVAPAAKGAGRLGRQTISPHSRWHFVELGTARMPARPFLRPALDANADQVVSILQAELAAGIARALKRQRRAGR